VLIIKHERPIRDRKKGKSLVQIARQVKKKETLKRSVNS
jgi:hypothetical protein